NEAHEKKFGRPADPIVGPAYACVQILANALSRAGAADRDKLRDAIAATDMTTVIGPVKFRPDGTGIVQAAFAQWQNGKQELVWPKEFATAPLAHPAPPASRAPFSWSGRSRVSPRSRTSSWAVCMAAHARRRRRH